jgi:4-hydroxy-2-oxoheptanedioate aldolase
MSEPGDADGRASVTPPDRLRARWHAGDPTFGGWVVGRDPLLAERVARCGFDEVTIDLQHAPVGSADLPALTMAVTVGGAVPLVRVVSADPWGIGRVLDLGAAGVIVPLVEDAGTAETVVRACRYPPVGTRSTGPVRARYVFGSDEPAVLESALVVLMIESRAGMGAVDEIAAIPGVDVVYVGPADLALSLGLSRTGRRTPAEERELDAALDRVVEACRRAGRVAGLHCPDGAAAAAAVERGFGMVTVTSDIGLVSAAGRAELERAQGGRVARVMPTAPSAGREAPARTPADAQPVRR